MEIKFCHYTVAHPTVQWEEANGTASWSYTWDTTKVPNGRVTIFVRCYDGGCYSEYVILTVYVRDLRPDYMYFEWYEDPLIWMIIMALVLPWFAMALTLYFRRKSRKP